MRMIAPLLQHALPFFRTHFVVGGTLTVLGSGILVFGGNSFIPLLAGYLFSILNLFSFALYIYSIIEKRSPLVIASALTLKLLSLAAVVVVLTRLSNLALWSFLTGYLLFIPSAVGYVLNKKCRFRD